MIDDNTTKYYPLHGDMLYELCLLNKFNNVCFLKNSLSISKIQTLANLEHFDVVIAFLVLHQIGQGKLDQEISIFEALLSLGDNIIIETANEVAADFSKFIEEFAKKSNGEFLGEVSRHYKNNVSKGRLFWFKSKRISNESYHLGISQKTFKIFNGVYP